MKELKHTPESWQWFPNHEGDYSIVKNQDEETQILIGAVATAQDAQRIVACVNAMAGIEDPAHFVGMAKNYIQQDTDIRALINAHENESTIDEVERLKNKYDLSVRALNMYINALKKAKHILDNHGIGSSVLISALDHYKAVQSQQPHKGNTK